MSIIRWNPSRELLSMEREFNKLFNSFGKRFGIGKPDSTDEYENAVWMPLTDIKEDKDNYYVMLDLPGISRGNVKVGYNNGQLSVVANESRKRKVKIPSFIELKGSLVVIIEHLLFLKKLKKIKLRQSLKMGSLR